MRNSIALVLGLVVSLSLWGCSDNDSKTDDSQVKDSGPDTVETDGAKDVTTDAATDVVEGDADAAEPFDPILAACPGSEGCQSNEGELMAGAAAVDISPTAYESPRVAYLKEESYCPPPTPKAPFGLNRCGPLATLASDRRDCGLDGLCPGDNLKTRISCDNGKCPTDLACNETDSRCYLKYSAPDADGSEGDGLPDYFLDCGTDRVCPCLDPDGAPSYYGKDNKCLDGHKDNPAYTAADTDGSEGNGTFEAIWIAGMDNDLAAIDHHDNIWARAIVLRTGDTTVAIVSVDLIGVFHPKVLDARQKVIDKLKDKHDIDYVVISSTHNHEGPDTMGLWGPMPTSGINPEYYEKALDGMAEAVAKAAGSLKKVTLKVGETKTGGKGYIRDSRDPKIIYDELVALQLNDVQSGDTVATVVNWGNHPEVLSDTNNYISSDFSHYVREGMEKAIPKAGSAPELPALGGVSIYLQGAVGCLMTPLRVTVTGRDGTEHDDSSFEKAEALGINVAVKAREALETGATIDEAKLSVRAEQFRLKVVNSALLLAFQAGVFQRSPVIQQGVNTILTELAVVQLGPITFFTLPGEVGPETLVGGYDGSRSFGDPIVSPNNENPPDVSKAPKGPYLLEKIPGKYKVFIGLANDEIGYIVPGWNFVLGSTAYFDEADGDHYEETNSLGPDTEAALLQAYDDLLKNL